MVMRERVTLAVLLALGLTAWWFVDRLGGLSVPELAERGPVVSALLMLTVLSAVFSAVATLIGPRGTDERDARVALRAQVFRGFVYLSMCFGLLGLAYAFGDPVVVNVLLLAILGAEFVSGLVMLMLYRFSA